ncbi:MAG: metallophosphoesterase family protein [Clostridia bacterium]|nr:metallophosphoesterase family protein [Clostridia bacterium]
MRIALIADIHANLPALQAVLRDIERRHSPDRIVSLGDQINLGPCPRETLALLKEKRVECLHGNHERYIESAMNDDPRYAGANFASLRFNAGLLAAEELRFPKEMRVGPVLLCHAMPGDDRFPVNDPKLALPRLRAMRFPEPTHIVCGHGHNPVHYRVGNLTLNGIGSAGCQDDGIPGIALYAVLDIEDGAASLRPCFAMYDTRALKPLFRASGMAAYCPIMAHLACIQMEHNHDYLVEFVQSALALAASRGEETISRQTWADSDAAFAWPDGVGTSAFWK